ncbi:hypothetical protein JANET_257 [Bacillus phage Janet]|nr:hypothetical protein JANET_257 [Bacillus phage Janet]
MEEKVTYEDACEFISKYLKEAKGIDMKPKHIFNLSSFTGDPFHVNILYSIAVKYYENKKALEDERSAREWDEAIWGIPFYG